MEISGKKSAILSGIVVPVRLYLALVFIAAAWPKIVSPYDFALSVATYQIIPLSLVNFFSIVIPWMELSAGILLLIGFWTKPSSLVIFSLLILFVIAVSIALAKGLDINCGCFASTDAADEIGQGTLYRDFVWLVMAIFILMFDRGRLAVDGFMRREIRHAK